MNKKILLIIIMGFAVFGILLAGALTLAKYNDTMARLCGEDLSNSCNVVQSSSYAYLINYQFNSGFLLQIPLSFAGVVFYTFLLLLSYLSYREYEKKGNIDKFKYYLLATGLGGVGFSAVYTWIQAYKIEAFCKFCLASAFDSLVIFILIILIVFGKNDKISKNTHISKKKPTKN